MERKKKAGILMPVSALPGKEGIGDFGTEARRFVDIIAKEGFAYWQILPLNPVGYGHSPYQPYSSYAIDETFIDLDDLVKRGYLARLPKYEGVLDKVDFEAVREFKLPLLRKAFEKNIKVNPHCLDKFIKENPWVNDYAIFAHFHRLYNASWSDWPEGDRLYLEKRRKLTREERKSIKFEIYLQMVAYRQWNALHAYANSKGIEIIGDVPFYVGYDSCDVYANKDNFLLDEVTLEPTFIAGVPPDYFSKTGQRWGNPIYNWEKMEKEGFAFLKERILRNAKLYDIIRLDHFRAFDTYWKIPSSCETAIDGEWIEAPGYAFFDLLFQEAPELKEKIIAEDLGDLRPEVLVLRDHYDFPGMNVVEFTFEDDVFLKKEGYDAENSVIYLGTHDNDTMQGFLDEMKEEERKKWEDKLLELGYKEGSTVDKLIRFCLDKPANKVILTVQDILNLDTSARINVPGIVDNVNWTFKIVDFKDFAARLSSYGGLLKKTGRA